MPTGGKSTQCSKTCWLLAICKMIARLRGQQEGLHGTPIVAVQLGLTGGDTEPSEYSDHFGVELRLFIVPRVFEERQILNEYSLILD